MDEDPSVPLHVLPAADSVSVTSHADVPEPTPAERVEKYFGNFYADVRDIVASICGSAADADDATQEAFLQLHRVLADGQQIENPRGWVFTAARHHALRVMRDRSRRKGRFEERLQEALVIAAAKQSPRPDIQHAERERHLTLVRALRSLSEEQRLLLSERAQGVTFRAMAERRGWPDFHWASRRVAAVMDRLRRCLEGGDV